MDFGDERDAPIALQMVWNAWERRVRPISM